VRLGRFTHRRSPSRSGAPWRGHTPPPGDDHPVKTVTTGHLHLTGEDGVLVTADLIYRPRDCLAVNMVLRGPDGVEAGWTFAWQLLAHGLLAPAGDGDITVRPALAPDATPVVEVCLTSSFTARMRFSARDIGSFVNTVRSRAHLDAKHIRPSLDAELTAITKTI
jgi:hypothetical protein